VVSRGESAVVLAPLAEAVDGLRRGQEEVLHLASDARAVKATFETWRDSLETARSESAAKQERLLERTEHRTHEVGNRVAQLSEQLQRIEKAALENTSIPRDLGERLDRIEKSLASVTSAKAAPPAADPLHTASVSPPKSADRDAPIEGWLLHEVYDGLAIVEGRRGQFFEVGRGDVIPGVGRIETIERRAKRWVVVTDRGIITTAR
jgi:hypothetical protein